MSHFRPHLSIPSPHGEGVGGEVLLSLRNQIDEQRNKANAVLNQMLLEQMNDLKIKYERATWDEKTGKEGKTVKEILQIRHIEALTPFHWGYEFNDIMARGGFDLLIGNPPWEVPQASR